MGCYLSKPITEKHVENMSEYGLRVGTCMMQGWRTNQEDAHSVRMSFLEKYSLFAVYDGHGGEEVSKWSETTLPNAIQTNLKQHKSNLQSFGENMKEIFIEHDRSITTESVIKELYEISDKVLPPLGDNAELKSELDGLTADAELSQEELLQKYGLNQDELKEKKQQVANIIMEQWNKMKDDDSDSDDDDSESEGPSKSLNDKNTDGPDENFVPEFRVRNVSAEEREKNRLEAKGDVILEDHSEASSEPSSDEDGIDGLVENEKENFKMEAQEICGRDSGTTCVLALYQRDTNEILVSNIGDSRAVLCRNGLAVDLSFDHKPEDEVELNRIKNAGGYLTADGRVKGGLNLSRAFGDHMYKDNDKIDLKDQMITAYPDVLHKQLSNEDEFIIFACDGIWNCMTSQECVDFVRDRLEKDSCISEILSELFDQCLAPDTSGDGTGCDNMTGIIVQLRPRNRPTKRIRSEEESEENGETKLTRTE